MSFQEALELPRRTEMRGVLCEMCCGFSRLQVVLSGEPRLRGQCEQQRAQPHVGRLLRTDMCKNNQTVEGERCHSQLLVDGHVEPLPASLVKAAAAQNSLCACVCV